LAGWLAVRLIIEQLVSCHDCNIFVEQVYISVYHQPTLSLVSVIVVFEFRLLRACLGGLLAGFLVGWLAGWLVGRLVGKLVDWLPCWLHWLAGCLVGWFAGLVG